METPTSSTTQKTRRPALSRWGLVAAALCPCLASLGFHFAGPAPLPMPPAAERPALAFDQYAVNLGPIAPMSHARAWFRFTNFSDRTVKITNLLPSCGCLKPRLEKQEYAPGETGQFFVRVATAGEQPGPRSYTITVRYLDPEPQSVQLTFRMELPPRQVYVTPRALLVYQFSKESTTKEILVSDNRSAPITVTGVECKADFVKVEQAETQTDHEGIQHTPVKVTIDPVPAGTHHTSVRIHTDDPKFPVLIVPVQVHRQPPMMGLRRSPGRSATGK